MYLCVYDPAVTPKASPFIKWPGGKREVLRSLLPIVPPTLSRYFEPFLGGAALYFAMQPRHAVLSDTNENLINLYKQVRDEPRELIRILKTFENSEDYYYQLRDMTFRSAAKRAARLLYLTRLSFNGIHRVNLRGEFNVPYGHKTYLSTCDEDQILAASHILQFAKIVVSDFEKATLTADAGDFIYFDPPYTVAHKNNGFIKYNENIFSWDDQLRLADHARILASRGCHVVVSNADHQSIHKLYRGFRKKRVRRFSRIAASSAHRRAITEMLYYSFGVHDA